MMNSSEIREHMKVVGSDGQHVGTVDRVQGNNIKLTKNDPAAGGQHHVISMDMVDTIENDSLKLNMPAQEVMSNWKSGETQDAQSASAAGAGAGAGSWSSMSGSDDPTMTNQGSSMGNTSGSAGMNSSDDDSQRGSGSMGYK